MVKSKKPSAKPVELASASPASESPTVVESAFDYTFDAWIYALSDGTVAHGKPGGARVTRGTPFTEQSQWGTRQPGGQR